MRIILIAFFSIVILGFGGCPSCQRSDDKPRDKQQVELVEPPTAPKPDKDGKTDPIEQAKYDVQRYSEAAAVSKKRYEILKAQRAEETLESQVAWITGLCLLFAAICGVAAFIVPIGKKTLVAAAIGFTTIAACAQAFREMVPYLPWIGGVVILAGGVWIALNWKKLGQTVKTASGYGERLEDWIRNDIFPDLDEEMRAKMEKLFEDVKSESKKEAELMGVHNPLQLLRGKRETLIGKMLSRIKGT